MYSMSSLVGYEPYVDNCVDIICEKLQSHSEKKHTIDMTKWHQWYAFDVIGEITVSPGSVGEPYLRNTHSGHFSSQSDLGSWKEKRMWRS